MVAPTPSPPMRPRQRVGCMDSDYGVIRGWSKFGGGPILLVRRAAFGFAQGRPRRLFPDVFLFTLRGLQGDRSLRLKYGCARDDAHYTGECCGITSRGSVGNPVVHSLLVTLGNHTIYVQGTYNWPCPDGHLPIWEMTRTARYAAHWCECGLRRDQEFCIEDQGLEFALIWRCSASTNRKSSPMRRSMSSRASCRMPSPSTKKSSSTTPKI